jgi:hypothetical protein
VQEQLLSNELSEGAEIGDEPSEVDLLVGSGAVKGAVNGGLAMDLRKSV